MTLEASLASLRHAARAATQAGASFEQAVSAARADGATWQQIGETLGMTRQNAHRRWRHLDEEAS